MKRVFKKNQVIVTTLALMIAVAGYLNYSGQIFDITGEEALETTNDVVSEGLLDIVEDSSTDIVADIESLDLDIVTEDVSTEDVVSEGTPGEAVLTSSAVSEFIADAKITREQVRAESKETLESLIDNESLSSEQKADAVNQLITMTEIAEQEVTVETLLEAKGFTDVVVTLTEDSADIVVIQEDITDANLAQIEDAVTRSTDILAENVVITPVQVTN